MASGNQTRRILIKVDTSESRGLREIADQMGLLNKNTKTLSGNLGFLTNVFRGWLGYLGVKELTRMSDEMQNLTNRLKIFTGSTEGAKEALEQIAGVADRTQQGVSQVGEVYARLAVSLKGSGATTSELTTLTESLINTFRVAGATTTETTNTIIQLSQAFASGQLRGQELRSVMEQNATLAGLLRERFGKDIYKKAQEGAISVSEVLEVLAKHQTEVNEQAQKLAPTFEQTLTKSMNSFSLAVGELNDNFQLSAKFAAVMGFAMENLGNILIVVGGVVTVMAVTRLPALIKAIQALRAATIAFAAANPLLLAFTALATVGALVYNNWDSLVRMMKLFRANVLELSASIEEYLLPLREKLSDMLGINMSRQFEQTRKNIDALRASAKQIREEVAASDKAAAGKGAPTAADADKNMQSLIDKIKAMNGQSEKAKKIKDILGELNKELQSGAITVDEYNKKLINFQLYKVNREFAEGKMDIFKYHEQLRDLEIAEFNRQLNVGQITMKQFNDQVFMLTQAGLKEQLDGGVISLTKYNTEMDKLRQKINDNTASGNAWLTGVNNYVKSVGTVADNIAKGIGVTFDALETGITDFIKTGKFNFEEFTKSILDDLTKIIVRAAIVQPLAQGILNFAGSSFGSAGTANSAGQSYTNYGNYAAKGMGFDNGVRMFAKGGIVDSPMGFTYGGGRNKGVMGEAGTEAILPLQRAGNGDLGVAAQVTPVTVNIINQAGADVQQAETTGPNGEKQIDIIITQKVRDGIMSGKYDSAMSTAYNVRRRGT